MTKRRPVTDQRMSELVDKFMELEAPEFDQWIESQPDADALGEAFILLFKTK